MLSRCCKTCFKIVFVAISCVSFFIEAKENRFKEEGKQLGKSAREKALDFKNSTCADDLMPPEMRGQDFNASEAKNQIATENIPKNPTVEFLTDTNMLRFQDYQLDDESIKQCDKIVEKFQSGIVEQVVVGDDCSIETCIIEDAPYDIEVNYCLNVNVTHIPKTEKSYKACKGHKSIETYTLKSSAKDALRKLEKKFAADSTIAKYKVKISDGCLVQDYEVKSEWAHKDNVAKCSNSAVRTTEAIPERWEEEDEWVLESPENAKISQSHTCSLVATNFTDINSMKTINGKNVFRSHWSKKLKFVCLNEKKKCKFLGSNLCSLLKKQCLREDSLGCSLWELVFKCKTTQHQKNMIFDSNGLLEDASEEFEYSPNTSFSEAVTKLKVFEEMEKELEKSGYGDITKLQLFPGKKQQCSKSVADDLMYDCCNTFKGLANDLQLSKCTADELALAAMKEKGQCHYIGAYDEKFLSLWTSRKEHVYCCFSSKLLRILQEEGRNQLGILWGTAEKPNCRGLSQEELRQIDFSKLDLSEAYEIPPEVDLSEKFKALETRLKDQVRNHNNENKSHD